jgi:HemY protein
MRAIPALVLLALLIAAAVFVAGQPGHVAIVWQGWEIDTSVAVMALGVIVFAIVVLVAWRVLRFILGGPRVFMRARRERRRRLGYRALTQGMVAVAAGDAEEAQKLARKADALLAEPPLTLLLSAQAAQMSGDEQAASRYFAAMLERKETEFLGLRGLLMQALRGGDDTKALKLAERAKALHPRTPWVLTYLLELQARAGQWSAAETTLLEAQRRKVIPKPAANERHAALLYAQADEAQRNERPSEAMRLITKAHALAPGFAPVAARYARMLTTRGQRRRARRALEAAWRAAPHPSIAEAYGELYRGEPALQRLKQFERLASFRPLHAESHLILAQASLEARLWGEARRHLAAAGMAADGDMPLPPRVCRMMAELEEAEHDDHLAARSWLGRAAANEALDAAWHCDHCGASQAQWTPLCGRCHNLATLAWCEAGRAAPQPPLELPVIGTVAAPALLAPVSGRS